MFDFACEFLLFSTAGFEVLINGIRVVNGGLYQIVAMYSPFGFNSRTTCTISHNGQIICKQGQTDGGPTIIYHLVKLADNDVITAAVDGSSVTADPRLHNKIQLNLLLIK